MIWLTLFSKKRNLVVKTGEYRESRTYYDYDSCPESDQAYLRDEKSHVLLKFGYYFFDGTFVDFDDLEIEACNVEKIANNENP